MASAIQYIAYNSIAAEIPDSLNLSPGGIYTVQEFIQQLQTARRFIDDGRMPEPVMENLDELVMWAGAVGPLASHDEAYDAALDLMNEFLYSPETSQSFEDFEEEKDNEDFPDVPSSLTPPSSPLDDIDITTIPAPMYLSPLRRNSENDPIPFFPEVNTPSPIIQPTSPFLTNATTNAATNPYSPIVEALEPYIAEMRNNYNLDEPF